MDSGYYAACTALKSRTEALDTIANNLANSSTTGYRARHNVFSSVLATTGDRPLSELNTTTNNYGVLSSTRFDISQGSLQKTGNELDLGIAGPGFFSVQTATAGVHYTRNGNFHVSTQGLLVTAAGDKVLGEKGVIAIVGAPVAISPDGTISVNGAIAGRLKMVEFPAAENLESVGNNNYSAPAGTALPATHTTLEQGALESSNVNAITSVVEMISAQREAETMRRVLTMFNNDMDKTAAEDLPRVG
ncbi:MAG TPA: flagellar basal-body rod protein FlgF [Acidisarcina sp.]